MYPERQLAKQTGVGLPLAIFIVTVLSLIVLGMSQLQESSGKAISLQVQSQRAFFAAESGAQVTIAEIMTAAVENPINCSADKTITFTLKGLANCTARVECTHDGEVVSVKSFGVCGEGTPEEARRTIEVRLR
jgi:MSHA biogenesis protein MshP